MNIINNLNKNNLDLISNTLKTGNLVVIPTETVYGLAADALNPEAVKKIFEVKGRPTDNPLIVHISNIQMMKKFVIDIPDKAILLSNKFWPGPLTVILKKSKIVPDITTGGLDSVALRAPSHPMALKIINHSKLGLAAPSANISGKPSPTNCKHCENDLKDKVDIIVDGGECDFGVESTVISLIEKTPIILRPGVITKEDIEEVIGPVNLSENILHKAESKTPVLSPGVKYKHYAPDADIILVKSNLDNFTKYVNSINDINCAALVFEGEETNLNKPCFTYGKKDDYLSQTKNLFKVLREIDKTSLKKVYVRCPSASGISLAVYNRLIRAANFNIVNLND